MAGIKTPAPAISTTTDMFEEFNVWFIIQVTSSVWVVGSPAQNLSFGWAWAKKTQTFRPTNILDPCRIKSCNLRCHQIWLASVHGSIYWVEDSVDLRSWIKRLEFPIGCLELKATTAFETLESHLTVTPAAIGKKYTLIDNIQDWLQQSPLEIAVLGLNDRMSLRQGQASSFNE